jgi:hypothetical protein
MNQLRKVTRILKKEKNGQWQDVVGIGFLLTCSLPLLGLG